MNTFLHLVPIDVLYEVRVGRNTTIFKEQGTTYSEDCCFSIVFGPDYETIDLVAKTSDEASIWVTGLRLLITQKTGELEGFNNLENIRPGPVLGPSGLSWDPPTFGCWS